MIRLGLTNVLLLSLHYALRGCAEHDRGLTDACESHRRRSEGQCFPPSSSRGVTHNGRTFSYVDRHFPSSTSERVL